MSKRKKNNFKITRTEIFFVLALGILGFLLTTRTFLVWLNSLNSILGLLVYYIIMYSSLYLLSRFGLVIYKFHIKHPLQVLGATLVTFAFFVVVDWESPLINMIVSGIYPIASTTGIYFQSEDGAVFYLWHNIFSIMNVELLRWLTYIVSPIIIAIIGVYLISKTKIDV